MAATRLFSVLLLWLMPGGALLAASDTVSVHFPFNQSRLSEEARQELDAAIYEGKITDKHPMQIVGYSDEIGGNGYNLRLSRMRADNVKAYLIQSGFRAERITLITGKGEAGAQAAADPMGNQADRRVDIIKGESGTTAAVPEPPKPTLTTPAEPRKLSNTDISTVAAGETLVLDNILFHGGLAIIRPESCDAVDALFNSLRKAPNVRIRIEGHVCCPFLAQNEADLANSTNLSFDRARAVYNFLTERGIAADRLEYKGFGFSRPLNAERTGEEMEKNRRVEIRVIK